MWLPWNNHPTRACPFFHPNGHALINTSDPGTLEHISHVFVSLNNQFANLPEAVLEGRPWFGCVAERLMDLGKALPRHSTIKSVGRSFLAIDLCAAEEIMS